MENFPVMVHSILASLPTGIETFLIGPMDSSSFSIFDPEINKAIYVISLSILFKLEPIPF